MLWALLILCNSGGLQAITEDRVDIVEVNHVYRYPENAHVLSQVIWWNWQPELGHEGMGRTVRMRVVAWKMLKPVGPPIRTPRGWECLWHDGGQLRRVIADGYVETRTWSDPEIEDRRAVRAEDRRGLQ